MSEIKYFRQNYDLGEGINSELDKMREEEESRAKSSKPKKKSSKPLPILDKEAVIRGPNLRGCPFGLTNIP